MVYTPSPDSYYTEEASYTRWEYMLAHTHLSHKIFWAEFYSLMQSRKGDLEVVTPNFQKALLHSWSLAKLGARLIMQTGSLKGR